VLVDVGFDLNLVMFVVEVFDDYFVVIFVVCLEVKLIDFIGGSAFGDWLE